MWRITSIVTAAVVVCGPALAQPQGIALQIEPHSRGLVPGEPLRVVVESPVPLATIEGTFLDRRLDFVRAVAANAGERWTAWGVIPLSRSPGRTTLEISGRAVDGTAARGSRTLQIRSKSFPTQKLEVESKFVTPPAEVEARIERERKQLAEIYKAATVRAPATHPFIAPVSGIPTSTFGARRVFNGVPRDPHPGLDLQAALGTPVLASGAGTVVHAAELYYSGGTVILDHGGGLFTVYAHLSRIDVQVAQEVAGGTPVGLSGATGRVTGPHLHWGAKIGEIPFDPRALLDSKLFR